ncbi:hypothetical protein [Streptobacillus notomytis]|uniref:hypothetical protein n=1 Tax=Streptobacillus notomytis TaxID=1712031 RepID=UPI0009375E51|nr:hypothetical protein [Streptobacillus notomytis]
MVVEGEMMRRLKIFLLFLGIISNILFSQNIETNLLAVSSNRSNRTNTKRSRKVLKEKVKESKFLKFDNSKKIKLILSADSKNNFEKEEKKYKVTAEHNINFSTKLYELLKLSGGISFGNSIKPKSYYAAFGLDFKEYGDIEVALRSEKKVDFKYVYNRKFNDLDVDVKILYSLFSSERKLGDKEIEYYYGLDTNFGYNLGYNFRLLTDLDMRMSIFITDKKKKLIPYDFLIGAGIDYKNNIIAGVYVGHYNTRRVQLDRVGIFKSSEYNKGFRFRTYLGYEWEKNLSESSKISFMGKLGANIEKKLYNNLSVIVIEDNKKDTNNSHDDSFATLNPQLKLEYKFNDSLNIEMEYVSSIDFDMKGYQKSSNTIRAGVKYTWEK